MGFSRGSINRLHGCSRFRLHGLDLEATSNSPRILEAVSELPATGARAGNRIDPPVRAPQPASSVRTPGQPAGHRPLHSGPRRCSGLADRKGARWWRRSLRPRSIDNGYGHAGSDLPKLLFAAENRLAVRLTLFVVMGALLVLKASPLAREDRSTQRPNGPQMVHEVSSHPLLVAALT